jgi:hypothetical protein
MPPEAHHTAQRVQRLHLSTTLAIVQEGCTAGGAPEVDIGEVYPGLQVGKRTYALQSVACYRQPVLWICVERRGAGLVVQWHGRLAVPRDAPDE